jgi:hypothetical protein
MNASEDIAQALHYADRLPLRWVADEPLHDAERLADANLRVLAAVAQLEESAAPGDNPTAQELEIARLHHKLNLLLEIVGGLARGQLQVPEPLPLRLSWIGVSWRHGGVAPDPGTHGLVCLHLHAAVLQPLRWPAQIIGCDAEEARARFAPLGETCQRALERHVFLHHRRAVAERRQPLR